MGSLAKYCRELLYEWAFVVVVLTAIDSLDTLPLGCKTITNVVPKGGLVHVGCSDLCLLHFLWLLNKQKQA